MPSTDLIFSQAVLAGSPTHLVFGDDDSVIVPPVTVDAYALLGGIVASALALVRVDVQAYALLGGVTVSAAALYDNRVTRWAEGAAITTHQVARPQRTGRESAWATSLSKRPATAMPYTPALTHKPDTAAIYTPAIKRRREPGHQWQLGVNHAADPLAGHQTAIKHRMVALAPWQLAVHQARQSTEHVQTGKPVSLSTEHSSWQLAQRQARTWLAPFKPSRFRSGVQAAVGRYQTAQRPGPGKEVWPPVVVPPEQYVPDANLVFMCPVLAGTPTNLVFGIDPCDLPEVPDATVIVPIRRVYMVFNSASLRRVDGNIQLPTLSMSLNLDADSWTWGFSATLPGSALSDLAPGSNGAPVEIEATINGTAYRAVVEKRRRTREFGKNDLRIECRGKTALLDAPYAPVLSFENSTARTAQQLMEDVLTLNGEPMPWAVDWGLEDWLVPAGVFSHQGSYISALNAIAAAAGGYIQPHATLQRISVLPRYPVAPWNWGTVTPDFELPAAVTTQEGIEWVERPRYNRVYVSGQQAGILGQVTRAGSAGDLLAPMVTDALITTAAAARQRGTSVLGNTGAQAEVSLRLPVLPETGVILPGKFVRYVEEDAVTVRLGLVRNVSLENKFPQTWQTIGVETHV